jgi:hypothetical protein
MENDRAVLIAIGPAQMGAWKRAHAQTRGRISAIGERSDTQAYFEAADIFLMPTPVASLTSALEAGSYALPILELHDATYSDSIFDSESPGLDGAAVIRAGSLAQYRETLARLLQDEKLRATAGAAARTGLLGAHAGAGWLAHLEQGYASADAHGRRETIAASEPTPQFTPTDIKLCGMRPGLLARARFILARQTKSLPLRDRLKLYFSLYRFAGPFSPRYVAVELILLLVPRWQLDFLGRAFETTGLFRRFFDSQMGRVQLEALIEPGPFSS